MNTPFFPAWRPRLIAMGRKSQLLRSATEVEDEFARFLPKHFLQKGYGCRNRIYTRKQTFWSFFWQVSQPQTACRAVVRKMQAESETQRRIIDENTSAYCQARSRLPFTLLQQGMQLSAEAADRMAVDCVPGWNRPIKVVDATSFKTPDTVENRKKYHYPTGQKRGCGFPVLRALAIFSFSGGGIHQIVTAPCGTAELTMFRPLWATLKSNDILLGDRITGCFTNLAVLPLQGVDVVARLNQGRQLNLRMAKRLGTNDWITTFNKAYVVPPYMTKQEWATISKTITVRIIRSRLTIKGFRTKDIWIVTTLLDADLYPADLIAELYLRRWQIELSFRDLKTTLGLESLRCRTPQMIEKELRMALITYNCLRALMAEAAATHHIARQRISFKGTVDTIRSFHPAMLRATSARSLRRLHKRLLEILVADCLPLRPGRSEPRAVKRRPKPYPLLTKPRHIFKEIPHRGRTKAIKRPQIILT